jgi:hypothetical protein
MMMMMSKFTMRVKSVFERASLLPFQALASRSCKAEAPAAVEQQQSSNLP